MSERCPGCLTETLGQPNTLCGNKANHPEAPAGERELRDIARSRSAAITPNDQEWYRRVVKMQLRAETAERQLTEARAALREIAAIEYAHLPSSAHIDEALDHATAIARDTLTPPETETTEGTDG